LILASLFHRAFARVALLHRAVRVPMAALTADLLENLSIATLLFSYPRRLRAVAVLASAFSTVKWTAIADEAILVAIGLVAPLIQRKRQQ